MVAKKYYGLKHVLIKFKMLTVINTDAFEVGKSCESIVFTVFLSDSFLLSTVSSFPFKEAPSVK